MNKDDLIKLALPISIIIAAATLALGLLAYLNYGVKAQASFDLGACPLERPIFVRVQNHTLRSMSSVQLTLQATVDGEDAFAQNFKSIYADMRPFSSVSDCLEDEKVSVKMPPEESVEPTPESSFDERVEKNKKLIERKREEGELLKTISDSKASDGDKAIAMTKLQDLYGSTYDEAMKDYGIGQEKPKVHINISALIKSMHEFDKKYKSVAIEVESVCLVENFSSTCYTSKD